MKVQQLFQRVRKERNELFCPLCGQPMKASAASSGVYTCVNQGSECGNYGVSYRPPKVVQIREDRS